jgi:hypothetical protein
MVSLLKFGHCPITWQPNTFPPAGLASFEKAECSLPIKRQRLDIARVAAVVSMDDGDEFSTVVIDFGVDLDLEVSALVSAELAN